MFNIVASDLDGTLLSPINTLTPFTKKIIQLLVNHGIYFILATGRHYLNTVQILNYLDIKSYLITSNGAKIYNMNGKLIFSHCLNQQIADKLLNIVYHDLDIVTNVFRNDDWFTNKPVDKKDCYSLTSGCYHKIYKKGVLPADNINKIYFTSNNYQKLLNLEEIIITHWGNSVNVSFSLPVCLEVMPEGISKGYALQKVVKLLGYKLENCISFGDGMNDYEMLSMTGKGCIMKNAQQRLKDKLQHLEIIGSNAEEAVPNYLDIMFLKK